MWDGEIQPPVLNLDAVMRIRYMSVHILAEAAVRIVIALPLLDARKLISGVKQP